MSRRSVFGGTDLAKLLHHVEANRRVALLLRDDRASDWMLAKLLPRIFARAPNQVTVFTTKRGGELLRQSQQEPSRNQDGQHNNHDNNNNVYIKDDLPMASTATNAMDDSKVLRHIARWAIEHDVEDVVLGDTRVSSLVSDVSRLDGGDRTLCMGGHKLTGLEGLPRDRIKLHLPLKQIDEQLIDTFPISSSLQQIQPELHKESYRSNAIYTDDVDKLVQMAQRRKHQARFLYQHSHQLLHDSVLEASHWGYVVIRRSALLNVLQAHGRGGEHIVIHAMCRLVAHISGSNEMPNADDEYISRLTKSILEIDPNTSILKPLPKGRTVGGIVIRPATGRFAKRILQNTQNRRRRQRQRRDVSYQQNMNTMYHPDDLMILTREPDHETGSLLSTRLKGISSCSPLIVNEFSYWDNRFVLSCMLSNDHDNNHLPIFNSKQIYQCILADVDVTTNNQALLDNELYIRQIRKLDWEKITSITTRVKNFQVPYECIRALPAIFEKNLHNGNHINSGNFTAAPHLGISSRPDLIFTAIRMPKFRTLPESIDPGFRDEHINQVYEINSNQRKNKYNNNMNHNDDEDTNTNNNKTNNTNNSNSKPSYQHRFLSDR